jgi:two-component system, sensor histidine kinase
MQAPPIPNGEAERLARLRSYGILDTLPEQEYDDLAAMAAFVAQTPIALVSLVDADRQWFKARVGLDAPETPRDISFCGHVVADRRMLVVEDTLDDARFHDNPLVAGPPDIRFYAGAPLITPDDQFLGTLCVIDREPRSLTAQQMDLLSALARQVASQLELRRRLVELEAAQIAVQRANQARASFLGQMGHELRTPLNAIIGYSELLVHHEDTLDDAVQREYIGTVLEAGESLLALVDDVLDFRKVAEGKRVPKPDEFVVDDVVRSAARAASSEIAERGNRLEVVSWDGIFRSDSSMLRQALGNLLSNAARCAEGGLITLGAERTDGGLRLTVSHTGDGLSEEQQQAIWKPFEQTDSSAARSSGGTGLGLAITKRFAESLGGTVGVSSTPDEGSALWLEVPEA